MCLYVYTYERHRLRARVVRDIPRLLINVVREVVKLKMARNIQTGKETVFSSQYFAVII